MSLSLLALYVGCPQPAEEPDVRRSGNGDDSGVVDTGDTGEPVVEGCRATPRAAERERTVIVSLPYDARGRQADTWASMPLSADGELGEPTTFTMGRTTGGEVAFTPDGSLGVVPLEDGSVGILSVDEAGAIAVIEATWDGGFYAGRVIIDPTGETAWIVDGNWANNGGGIWRMALDCETGAPGEAERVLEGKLPADLLFVGDRALVVASEIAGTAAGDDIALLDWGTLTTLSGIDAFGDDDAIVTDAALTADREWVGIADYSEFSGVPTRVARVRIDGDALVAEGVVDVEDPMAIVAAPTGTLALVVSGYGDALFSLDLATGEIDELSYVGGRPALPGSAVAITRGTLDGMVFVAENQGIRQVMLDADAATDLGQTVLGDGVEFIPGAIGVTP